MPYMTYDPAFIYHRLFAPNGLTTKGYGEVDLGEFPEADLPLVRRALPEVSTAHCYHSLLPGGHQLLSLPDSRTYLYRRASIFSSSLQHRVLVSGPVRSLLTAHTILSTSHITNDDTVWQTLNRHFNYGTTLPRQLPVLWNVHLAASEATAGSVVELISHGDDTRSFASLLFPVMYDQEYAIFSARILGSGPYKIKVIIKMPVEFVLPDILTSSNGHRVTSVDGTIFSFKLLYLRQSILYDAPVHDSSVALLPSNFSTSTLGVAPPRLPKPGPFLELIRGRLVRRPIRPFPIPLVHIATQVQVEEDRDARMVINREGLIKDSCHVWAETGSPVSSHAY